MKKTIYILASWFLLLAVGLAGGLAAQDTCYASGDFNGDGNVLTVADLIWGFRMLACEAPAPESLYQADLNGDCRVDTAYVRIIVNYFFYGPGALPRPFPHPTCCNPVVGTFLLGDINQDGDRTPADAVLMLSCVFGGGGNCSIFAADLNFDQALTPADVVEELNQVFTGRAPSGCL